MSSPLEIPRLFGLAKLAAQSAPITIPVLHKAISVAIGILKARLRWQSFVKSKMEQGRQRDTSQCRKNR